MRRQEDTKPKSLADEPRGARQRKLSAREAERRKGIKPGSNVEQDASSGSEYLEVPTGEEER